MSIINLQQSCAESWGHLSFRAVNNALQGIGGVVIRYASHFKTKIVKNSSKNKALLEFAFAAKSTIRLDSEFSGE